MPGDRLQRWHLTHHTQVDDPLTPRGPRWSDSPALLRNLRSLPGRQVQHEDIAFAPVAVGDEGHPGAVGREHRVGVVVGPEGELLGGATLDGQAEQMAQHGENQALPVRGHGDVGCRDLASFKLNRARLVVLCRGWAHEPERHRRRKQERESGRIHDFVSPMN